MASDETSDADKVRMLLAEAGYPNVDLSEDGLSVTFGMPPPSDHEGIATAFERAWELLEGEKVTSSLFAYDAYGNQVEVPKTLD